MSDTLTIQFITDKPNDNGVVFPKPIVKQLLDEYQSRIDNQSSIGIYIESVPENITHFINLNEASHIITSFKENDNGFLIEFRILNTPYGQLLKQRIDVYGPESVVIGFRAFGKMENKQVIEISNITSIDIRNKQAG